ncbi:MAG: dihydroorotate dehydrogenase electron transfer subunit [Lachnospiraceae bacterium]|nr:dihydroorotate dehydrogenase electron transfer subunit [Lachnospiraceae bacterium]
MGKQKDTAKVIKANKLQEGIYELWLETKMAVDAHPGQFVAVYPKNQATLLPRPISICEVNAERTAIRLVYRVVGSGTTEFSGLKQGDTIQVLGILGNGYDLSKAKGKKVLLLGGGIGIPPILEMAKQCQGEDVTIGLGYRDGNLFLKEEFDAYGRVIVATEDGSVGTKGHVLIAMDELEKAEGYVPDVIYSCGPMPMLRGIKAYAAKHGIPAYLSLEERMACGVGACLGCVTKTTKVDHHSKVNNARICTDGPVFLADDVEI